MRCQQRQHPISIRRPIPIAFPCLTLLFLLLHHPIGCLVARQKQPNGSVGSFCHFPESSERQFFFDIRSDTAPRSIVLDTVVEPPDARLAIANVRSNNLPSELDVNGWLSLEKRANGQFLVHTSEQPLGLPPYPSAINQSLLYVTVKCNGRLYPLMTIRVRAVNSHSPQWIGQRPYEVTIPKTASQGAVFDTPLLALDQDPADHFPLAFSIQPPHDRDFGIILADRNPSLSVAEQVRLLANLPEPLSRRVEDWIEQQMPPLVQLKVLAKVLPKSSYLLNVTATDRGLPEERRSWTQLRVFVKDQRELSARFSRIEYFGNFTKELQPGAELIPSEPLVALFPSQRAGQRIQYELDGANPYSQLFQMEPDTGRLRLAQPMPDRVPQTLELDILAHLLAKENLSLPAPTAHAKLILTDQTEVRLTYFTQCHYQIHLAENPSSYTRVLHFQFKGDVEGVDLLNGTDLFKVDQYGTLSVLPGVDIDRERTERIVVKARLRSKAALHPKSLELCQIATADILIDDVNDHSPRFTRRSYRFRIEPNPFNNTEVGSLRAVDGDRGEFGRIRYRMLDEFVPDGQGGEEPLPFVLFQADGTATLFFVVRPLHLQLGHPYKPQSEYTFTVEAYDSDEDPRTDRVTVNVRLEDTSSSKDAIAREQEFEEMVEPPVEARDQPPVEDDSSSAARDSPRRSLPEGNPVKALAARTEKGDKETRQQDGASKSARDRRVSFSQEHFVFRLASGGGLREGQTIGWVKVKQDFEDEEKASLEFAVEEGIAGFVGVDSASGRLFVGPQLEGDKFEEIRFSIAAQDPQDGRILATALVSVLIDEAMQQPQFEQSLYHFTLDLTNGNWPISVGQVRATIGNENRNKTMASRPGEVPPLIYLLETPPGTAVSQWFSVDRENGWIRAERAPSRKDLAIPQPIEFGVRACLRQNGSSCADAKVRVDLVGHQQGKQKRPTIIGANKDNEGEDGDENDDGDGATQKDPVEFEQYRYSIDLMDRSFVPEDTSLLQLRLLRVPQNEAKRIRYRLVPSPSEGGSQDGFSLEEAGIAASDIELNEENGDLRVTHDLRFLPTGPTKALQLTAQAVQSDGEGVEQVLASTAILIRSRLILDQQQRGEAGGQEGGATRLEFIPLPKTIFLSSTKAIGSTILRVSVRAQNPKDGSWHLLPLAAFQSGDGHPMQVDYWVEEASEDGQREGKQQKQQQFTMRDNLLQLGQPLRPGESTQLTIRARLQRRRPLVDDLASEEIRASTAEHRMRIVVMAEEGGRQRFPVFERISHEFKVDPHANFPITLPPLNASLAGGQQIRFSLFPARSGDPTDGLEIHPQTGQIRVHQQFLEQFAEKGGEVFLVVRAVNDAAPEQFFSDASVELIVLPKVLAPLQFDSPLYRFVVSEDQEPGTVVNGGSAIQIADPALHPNARIRLQFVAGNDLAKHFGLLPNGTLLLRSAIDMEAMEDASRGIVQMEAIAEEAKTSTAMARIEVQVLDKDEYVPDFVPLFPEFQLQLPIMAGQPIGRLTAKDQDFTDRQGSALAFRAISGNASRLVHVQRDGLLLVKDPNGEAGTYTLLVEVRDHDGLIARTTAKFMLTKGDGEQTTMAEGNRQSVPIESPSLGVEESGEVEEKGTTVDVPLPEGQPKPSLAILSVHDSIHSTEPVRFVLEENPEEMFRLDPDNGELFMADKATFGGVKPKEEYEVRVRIEQAESPGQASKLMGRRVYTVRLVPRQENAITTTTTMLADTNSATMLAEENTDEPTVAQTDGPTTLIANELATTTPTSTLASSAQSATERKTRWTLWQTSVGTTTGIPDDEQQRNTESVPRVEIEEGTTEESPQTTVPSIGAPMARPLTRKPSPPNEGHGHPRFALSRYHWVVTKPQREILVGHLEVLGEAEAHGEMAIEPPQFRQWFRIEGKSGNLFLREVPPLFGRQRAKFHVFIHSSEEGGQEAETAVTVDLNLPPNPASATELPIGGGLQSSTEPSTTISGIEVTEPVEIAENSDQHQDGPIRRPSAVHGTTLTAIDTRFTVSISPMHFTQDSKQQPHDEEDNVEGELDQQRHGMTRWTASTSDEQIGGRQREGSSTPRIATSTLASGRQQRVGSATDAGGGGELLKFGADQFKAMLPEGRYGNSGAQLSLRPHPLAKGMPPGVEYSIEQEKPEDGGDGQAKGGQQPLPFYVHRESGELIAFAEIDREERAKYQFRVKAFHPATGASASTLVTVQILDVNDNFPQFLEPLVRAIPVGRLTPAGTRLAQFRAMDPDEGGHGRVSFRLEQDPSDGWFRVEPTSGELVLAQALPTEEEDKRDQFELIISALDGGRPALRTEHHVRIEVFPDSGLDGPEFRRSEYNAGKVPAGAAQNGTFVWQLTAGPSQQIQYALIDAPVANLFVIDAQSGQIRMGRRPLDSERGRQWTLNVSATEGIGPARAHTAYTAVNIFLEPLPAEMEESANGQPKGPLPTKPANAAPSTEPSPTAQMQCQFAERVFHAELPENTEGRQRLTILKMTECEGRRTHFVLHQGTEAFELDARSGELFAIAPLDREKKSLHFLVANLSSVPSGVATVHEVELSNEKQSSDGGNDGDDEEARPKRRGRQSREREQPAEAGNSIRSKGRELLFNGLVEQAKAKLADNQALVLVRVLDRNDNAPQLQQLTSEGQIVFAVDWQSPVLQPIGRVQAHDPDEHPQLEFSLEQNSEGIFAINSSSGVIQLMKSLQTEAEDEFRMAVAVSDGEHTARAPLTVYKLQPGTNIVLLVIDQAVEQVDVLRAVRHLNQLLNGLEVDVLVKQVFIGEDGLADPRRTHLLVYAFNKQTRVPIGAAKLKELLEEAMPQLKADTLPNSSSLPMLDSPLRHLASVFVPDYGPLNAPFRLTSAEITLLAVSALLVFCVCAMLFMLLRCCKRRQELISKSDLEYMVDSQVASAGPRPYNVELITRKAAQAAQIASRRMAEPLEECTMSAESRATLVASSGVYGTSGGGGSGQLGGPLRRTARTMESSSSSVAAESPPAISMGSGEQGKGLLILRAQKGRRNAGGRGAETHDYESTEQQLDKSPGTSAENSPETMPRTGASGSRGAPRREPPPPPTSSPPELRQPQQRTAA